MNLDILNDLEVALMEARYVALACVFMGGYVLVQDSLWVYLPATEKRW